MFSSIPPGVYCTALPVRAIASGKPCVLMGWELPIRANSIQNDGSIHERGRCLGSFESSGVSDGCPRRRVEFPQQQRDQIDPQRGSCARSPTGLAPRSEHPVLAGRRDSPFRSGRGHRRQPTADDEAPATDRGSRRRDELRSHTARSERAGTRHAGDPQIRRRSHTRCSGTASSGRLSGLRSRDDQQRRSPRRRSDTPSAWL